MKVSIIVPVYNVSKYIKRCLDSLVKQTLSNVEIILVNDGSEEDEEVLIKEYMLEHNNIKYYKKKNGGLSSARNYGLKKAIGEYILFVDSDDYIDENMCLNLYNVAKKNNCIVMLNHFS